MDKYFLHSIQCMLKGKTQEYRAELMRRLKKANAYMNKTGGSIHSRQMVVLMMLQLDEEFENEGNIMEGEK
jgi:hypothetical protein